VKKENVESTLKLLWSLASKDLEDLLDHKVHKDHLD